MAPVRQFFVVLRGRVAERILRGVPTLNWNSTVPPGISKLGCLRELKIEVGRMLTIMRSEVAMRLSLWRVRLMKCAPSRSRGPNGARNEGD